MEGLGSEKESFMSLPRVLVQVDKLELAGKSEKLNIHCSRTKKRKFMASSMGTCCLRVATNFVGPEPSMVDLGLLLITLEVELDNLVK